MFHQNPSEHKETHKGTRFKTALTNTQTSCVSGMYWSVLQDQTIQVFSGKSKRQVHGVKPTEAPPPGTMNRPRLRLCSRDSETSRSVQRSLGGTISTSCGTFVWLSHL